MKVRCKRCTKDWLACRCWKPIPHFGKVSPLVHRIATVNEYWDIIREVLAISPDHVEQRRAA